MIQDREVPSIIAKRDIVAFSQEVLEKDGIMRLQVKGNCMFPLVRDKDFIYLKAIPFEQLRIGDIAVYRISEERMHVNVACGRFLEADACIFLGTVLAIKRSGKKIVFQGHLRRLRNMLWLPWYLQEALVRKFILRYKIGYKAGVR